MGGVGKTIIARAIFYTNTNQFDGACFLADIKENKDGMHSLQNILLSEVLKKKDNYVNNKEDEKHMIARRLRFMKVLVVLDDIDHRDHFDNLAGNLNWFGPGSRIIATTRDKHLIGKNDVVYEVTPLLVHDAIKLFHQYAFKDDSPDEHIKKLAWEVVSHAKGLPLALRLRGIMLHNKDTTMWRGVVDMIKSESSPDIIKNLKISFEGLQDKEKMIFLDIACFFRGKRKDETIEMLESYDSYASIRVHGLIEKALVFISAYNTIQMHDLIQDMGRYVVKMQKDSEKPTRLWNIEDFEDVMVNNTGTMALEAIWFTHHHKNLCLIEEAMKNMQKLRILCTEYLGPRSENDSSIDYLSNNLRWFVWWHYPWKLLPQNFNPRWLVHLELFDSSLHYLWNEIKQLPSLRRLVLRCSKSLKRTPDFTGMPNLEYLDLSFCTSLEEVHHSLGCSRKLIKLNLYACQSLERFPCVNVESLKSLNLKYCSSLEKLPEFLGIMKLNKEITISRFYGYPRANIHLQPHLTELDWSGIDVLVALPSFICKLKCLVKLDVSRCSELESLPEEIADLENLEVLDARYTLLSQPLSSIVRLNKLKVLTFGKEGSEDGAHFVFPEVNEGLLSLEQLDLSCCNLTDGGLSEDIRSLYSLKVLNLSGSSFEYLPRSIAQLGALRSLDLSNCYKLKELPSFTGMTNLDTLDLSGNHFEHLPQNISQLGGLRSLDLSCSGKLKEFPCFTKMPNLDTLDLSYCNLIDGGLLKDIGCLSSLKKLNLSENHFEHLPRTIAQLGALQSLDLSDCKRLKELPEIPQQLDTIYADWSSD